MLKSNSDEIYPTCIRAYGMAQKLQCDKLCNLCIEHMLEHCETLTAAGYWGFPRPSDVVLAWKVTWSHYTLRQFCAIMWRHPEAQGLMEMYEGYLPAGFAVEVMTAGGVDVVSVRPEVDERVREWLGMVMTWDAHKMCGKVGSIDLGA